MRTISAIPDISGSEMLTVDGIPVFPIFGGSEPTLSGIPADEFATWASKHHVNGWHPIPIGRIDPAKPDKPPGKVPWLTGQIGFDGEDADPAEFDTWPRRIASRITKSGGVLNLGTRAPVGVVGVDADGYDGKRGLITLAERQTEWDPLPPTFMTTARDDGSGIRWFGVPADYQGPAALAGDVELIDRFHRLAAIPPSIHHTGQPYRLYGPNGDEITPGIMPPIADLPPLPEGWLDALAKLAAKAGVCRDGPVTGDAVRAFAAEHTTTTRPGALDAIVDDFHLSRDGKRKRRGRLEERTALNRHDAEVSSLLWSARGARVDKFAWTDARDAIEAASRFECNARGETFNSADFAHSEADAVRAALSKPLDEIAAQEFRVGGTDTRKPDDWRTSNPLSDQVNQWASATPIRAKQIADQHVSATDTAGQDRPPRNAPLDLKRLRTEPPKPVDWLLPGILARDSYVSLSSAPGTGKSILTRAIAVDASLGRSALDLGETFEPARVIYLDAENGDGWWRDGLDDMDAPIDLPNLAVVCYPDLGGLDTAKGAREFLTLISDLARDQLDGIVDLVVLDTVSRFIAGGENDADTWSQFYRLAVQPLRDQHVAVLRLDHLGKDADRGPRGSSHKLSDVDADFRLTTDKPGSDELTLTLGKRRRHYFTATKALRRVDGPLRHEPGLDLSLGAVAVRSRDGSMVPTDPDVAALVADMDRLSVAVPLGRASARAAYTTAGGVLAARNDVWAAVVKFRKSRPTHGGSTP